MDWNAKRGKIEIKMYVVTLSCLVILQVDIFLNPLAVRKE